MKNESCPRASALADAAARRLLAAEERAHARDCDLCATELALAASGALARGLVVAARLPTARQTLLRARLEARRREAERRLRPLAIWQAVALAVAVATGLWLVPPMIDALVDAPTGATAASPAQLVFALGLALLAALPLLAVGRRRSV